MSSPKPPSASLGDFDLALPKAADAWFKRFLGLSELEKRYRDVRQSLATGATAGDFCRVASAALGTHARYEGVTIATLRKISGPLLFVSNHPFGAVDALALVALMSDVRADYRFVANAILRALPELAPVLVPIQVMGDTKSEKSRVMNAEALLKMTRFLRDGGAVGMFPAGEVAELSSWVARRTTDRKWHSHTGRIAQRTKATVIPVDIAGESSALFRYGGYAVPELRLALLAREMLAPKGDVRVTVREPILAVELAHLSAEEATSTMRARVLGEGK